MTLQTGMLPLTTRPLMQLTVELEAPQQLGSTPAGERRIVPIAGGVVSGERLQGRILPGGGDWALTRPDGVLLLDVRLSIQSNDGALIYCTYTGMRHGDPDAIAALARGESVDPARLYFRIQPRFETSAPSYTWLNKLLSVGVGRRLPMGPQYDLYEIL